MHPRETAPAYTRQIGRISAIPQAARPQRADPGRRSAKNRSRTVHRLGAVFLRDTSKELEVWFHYNEAGCKGALYFMVPGYQDSAYFLFYNQDNDGPTRINLTELGFQIPHLDTIFLLFLQLINHNIFLVGPFGHPYYQIKKYDPLILVYIA